VLAKDGFVRTANPLRTTGAVRQQNCRSKCTLVANRQRIVEFLPTAYRGALRLRKRHGLVEVAVGVGAPSRRSAPSLVPCPAYNVPRGQPPAAAPRRTSCRTNSRRASAPSVSASLAGLSSTSA